MENNYERFNKTISKVKKGKLDSRLKGRPYQHLNLNYNTKIIKEDILLEDFSQKVNDNFCL